MTAPAKAPLWLWLAWAGSVLVTSGSLGTLTLFGALVSSPRAFSNRDGQGAAMLAVMILVVALGVALVGAATLFFSTRRLRQRHAVSWVTRVALAVPVVVGALGFFIAILG
ncbi:MAG: hypothetical protein SFW67_07175 [Myxococcaceae bacterium]|nr:hypothetical protein [Myxococcaceae bacterium]